ncbi:unnamed protein product [Musa acuminata subsp. burmannicoides]
MNATLQAICYINLSLRLLRSSDDGPHFTSSVFPLSSLFLHGFDIFPLSRWPLHPKLSNFSTTSTGWSSAGTTWHGGANGTESDGGACGYGAAVHLPPFSPVIAAGNRSTFTSGKGCDLYGACAPWNALMFQHLFHYVKCTGNPARSGNPVTVVMTDECPGSACLNEPRPFRHERDCIWSDVTARANISATRRRTSPSTVHTSGVRSPWDQRGLPCGAVAGLSVSRRMDRHAAVAGCGLEAEIGLGVAGAFLDSPDVRRFRQGPHCR